MEDRKRRILAAPRCRGLGKIEYGPGELGRTLEELLPGRLRLGGKLCLEQLPNDTKRQSLLELGQRLPEERPGSARWSGSSSADALPDHPAWRG